jgi:endonuclease IV
MNTSRMKNRRDRRKHTFRVGFHTSIANGISRSIERAVSLRCTTMQIFSHNPRQWRQSSIPDEEVQRFKTLRKIHDINPVFIHASYLINLASLSSKTLQKSIELLSYELGTAGSLGVEYVILHTGSAGGAPERNCKSNACCTFRGIAPAREHCGKAGGYYFFGKDAG